MAETAPPQPLVPSLLEELPDEPSPEAPGSEQMEARLDLISGLVNRGAYAEASRAAEALLSEGGRDVRLVSPYLFGVFLEHGLEALPIIFSSLGKVFTNQWESFGPAEKKTLLAQSGLRWLLKALNKHLDHHSRIKDETWQRWCEPGNREPVRETLILVGEVSGAIESVLPGAGCERPLSQLTTWLSEHLSTLPDEPLRHEEEPAREEAPEDAGDEDENTRPEAPPPPTPAAPKRAPVPPVEGPVLPVSPALALLMRKLATFDTLLERGDLPRASVVAADMLHTLDHFDPRVYLPTLFSRFFVGLSTHADAVETLLQNTESLAFRSLDQLYRVDLDAFLAHDTEPQE